MKPLTIVADENIPGVQTLFAGLGSVQLVNGRTLSNAQLQHADVLLVRSVTPVNEELLAGSAVRFVGTATIGIDHLDVSYLTANGIGWANAPGSNADSVVDYVISALCRLNGVLEMLLAGAEVGIIGMGNVGARLYQRLMALGIRCRGYDPLIPQNRYPVLTDLDRVLQAEVICCHAPLTREGEFPSYHLLNPARLATLAAGTVLLNAGRGEVIDNAALLAVLAERQDLCVVLDVWEHEPLINRELLKRVDLATPHIAGYSYDGKLAGAMMIYQACCQFFAHPVSASTPSADDRTTLTITTPDDIAAAITEAVLGCYDVAQDDQNCRGALLHDDSGDAGAAFDRLRKNYPVRREFSHYHLVSAQQLSPAVSQALRALGFSVGEA